MKKISKKQQLIEKRKKQIEKKLDLLAELRSRAEKASTDYEIKVQDILEPVRPQLSALEKRCNPSVQKATAAVEDLEEEIKGDVIAFEESVKGESLMAVYTNGRLTWDSKALDGFAAAHPELEKFRKTGAPGVSIREVKDAD